MTENGEQWEREGRVCSGGKKEGVNEDKRERKGGKGTTGRGD